MEEVQGVVATSLCVCRPRFMLLPAVGRSEVNGGIPARCDTYANTRPIITTSSSLLTSNYDETLYHT